MGKRLYRSRYNKVLAGVCGGIADYFAVDPAIIRLIWVVLGFAGAGVLAYIIAALIIPEQPVSSFSTYGCQDKTDKETEDLNNFAEEWKTTPKYDRDRNRLVLGGALIVFGLLFLSRQFLHWIDMRFFIPALLVAAGAVIIFKGRRDKF